MAVLSQGLSLCLQEEQELLHDKTQQKLFSVSFIKISFAPSDAICYDDFTGYSFSWQEPYHLPDRQRIPDGMQQNKKGKGRRTEKFSGEIFRLTFPWKYTTIRTEKRT